MENDINAACRICLKTDEITEDIFSNQILTQKFTAFTQLKIKKVDGMSSKICENCKAMLTVCSNFKDHCVVVAENLRILHYTEEFSIGSDGGTDILMDAAYGHFFLQNESQFLLEETMSQTPTQIAINIQELSESVSLAAQKSFEQPNFPYFRAKPPTPEPIGGNRFKRRIRKKREKQTCKICCKNVSSLTSHMVVHTGEKKFACNLCCKKYASRTSFAKHRVTHTISKSYKCYVCDENFENQWCMFNHRNSHFAARTTFLNDEIRALEANSDLFAQLNITNDQVYVENIQNSYMFRKTGRTNIPLNSDKNNAQNGQNATFVDQTAPKVIGSQEQTAEMTLCLGEGFKCMDCETFVTDRSSFEMHQNIEIQKMAPTISCDLVVD